jgi:hypothetical protein
VPGRLGQVTGAGRGGRRQRGKGPLFGPANVTRAVLPQLRAQRPGLVVTISSTTGMAAGGAF